MVSFCPFAIPRTGSTVPAATTSSYPTLTSCRRCPPCNDGRGAISASIVCLECHHGGDEGIFRPWTQFPLHGQHSPTYPTASGMTRHLWARLRLGGSGMGAEWEQMASLSFPLLSNLRPAGLLRCRDRSQSVPFCSPHASLIFLIATPSLEGLGCLLRHTHLWQAGKERSQNFSPKSKPSSFSHTYCVLSFELHRHLLSDTPLNRSPC